VTSGPLRWPDRHFSPGSRVSVMNEECSVTEADAGFPEPLNAWRSPRFYAKLLLGIVLIGGMAVGWWAMQRQKTAAQQQAAAEIAQLGGEVLLDFQWSGRSSVAEPKRPPATWFQRLCGEAMFERFVAVDLQAVTDIDLAVACLSKLPFVTFLNAGSQEFTDQHVVKIGGMGHLRFLVLSGSAVSDAGVERLNGLRNLETLDLSNTRVSDQTLSALTTLRKLRELNLENTRTTEKGIQQFQRRRPQCQVISD
jgi:hypothetical protein